VSLENSGTTIGAFVVVPSLGSLFTGASFLHAMIVNAKNE
jgi:hypothetical protein